MGKEIVINLSKINSEIENIKRLDNAYQNAQANYEPPAVIIAAYHEWYDASLVFFSRIFPENDRYLRKFEDINNEGNEYVLNHNYHHIHSSYAVLLDRAESGDTNKANPAKPPLVFISHSHDDQIFVQHLVDLLEIIGLTPDNLFCSSIPEYWIDLGKNFIEVLKNNFQSNSILIIYVHSHRLYNSIISMNEMGAAWVLQTQHISILMPDFDFEEMKGVVTKEDTSIKVSNSEAKDRLNQMKDILCEFLNLPQPNSIKWEHKRDLFLQRVNTL